VTRARSEAGGLASAGRPNLVIRSGGQTGVDRAALDAALAAGFTVRGWCPKGRLAEDGLIPQEYPLEETPTDEYAQRTRWNVRDSDATLIVASGPVAGGTACTIEVAGELGRPVRVVDPQRPADIRQIAEWIDRLAVRDLNVAGPRESSSRGIYRQSRAFLDELLAVLSARD
jgi:predicted Rossmann fold nucleotide-binding protein DprA/Smf involved in DNA uptake